MVESGGPGVVFVVLDTVRKDRLSCYGYERETTPTLDAFSTDSVRFESAVAPAPWTLPVHASLFTGLYPSQHRATQERPYLDGPDTLAELLADAGYDTACHSSNAWITPYTGLTRGFAAQDNFFEVMPGDLLSGPLARAWRALNDNPTLRSMADRLVAFGNIAHEYLAGSGRADSKTPAVIDRTIDFIDGADSYFAFINLMDAHLPYYPPESHREVFAPGVDPVEVCQNAKEYNSGARDIDADEWDAIRGLYDAEIRHIDAQLDRLFTWLRDNDEWDDTLVVVCADHGELHGEHGLYGHEFNIYDPLVNVPLLVKHPDLEADVRDDQVELIDLYHTVLDHADVPATDATQPLDADRSLLSETYRSFDDAEYAFVEYDRPVVELNQLESKADAAGISLDEDSRFYSRMRASRRVDAKLIVNERIPDEYYRLDVDPGEAEDRLGSGDPSETELRDALDRFVDRVGGSWGEPATEADLDHMSDTAQDRLRDLGYLE